MQQVFAIGRNTAPVAVGKSEFRIMATAAALGIIEGNTGIKKKAAARGYQGRIPVGDSCNRRLPAQQQQGTHPSCHYQENKQPPFINHAAILSKYWFPAQLILLRPSRPAGR